MGLLEGWGCVGWLGFFVGEEWGALGGVVAFVVGEDFGGVVGAGGVVEVPGGSGGVGGELVEGAACCVEGLLLLGCEECGVGSGGPGCCVSCVAVEGECSAVGAGLELGLAFAVLGVLELVDDPLGCSWWWCWDGELGLVVLFFGHGVCGWGAQVAQVAGFLYECLVCACAGSRVYS